MEFLVLLEYKAGIPALFSVLTISIAILGVVSSLIACIKASTT